jgi:hypothetical protein
VRQSNILQLTRKILLLNPEFCINQKDSTCFTLRCGDTASDVSLVDDRSNFGHPPSSHEMTRSGVILTIVRSAGQSLM